MSPDDFAAVLAEYDASRSAAQVADRRHQAAARALMDAQCGEQYGPTLTKRKPALALRSTCTLPAGHDGEHGAQPRGPCET